MKYKIVGTDEDDVRVQKAIESANQTCPCGSQLAGILMGFLLAFISDLIIHNEFITMVIMCIGSAFGTLGSQLPSPFSIKSNDFISFSIIVFIMSLIFRMFFPVTDGMGSIFMLTVLSSSTTNYMRPLLLIPLSIGYHSWIQPPVTRCENLDLAGA